MTAISVALFFIGCAVGAFVADRIHRRPSKFDQWRAEQYKKYGGDHDRD